MSVIQWQFNPDEAKQNLQRYFEQIRQRIMTSAKEGMKEAMIGLALRAIDAMQAAGVQNRTGLTASSIVTSPKAWITPDQFVKGTVSGATGNYGGGNTEERRKNTTLWLEAGVNEPSVTGKLMAFFTPDGKLVFTRKRRAYEIPGHGPFMNEALQSYEQQIVGTIRNRITEDLAS